MNKFCGFVNFGRNYIREEFLMKTISEKILPKNQTYIGEHAVFIHNGNPSELKRTVSGYEFSIVGNCRIKNYDELKLSLIKYGYCFSDTSELEAVLYAYIHYGESCVGHLDGEISFAVWDSMRQRVFIYHNITDKQPLFYATLDDTMIFGNDLLAINNYPNMKFKISKRGFCSLMLMDEDIFTNLFTLKSGQYMVLNRCGFIVRPVFELIKPVHTFSGKCYEIINNLLLDSVRNTLDAECGIKNFCSNSDIISTITYGENIDCKEALKEVLANISSPLFAIFDKEKLFALSENSTFSDEWLIEYLLKINYLFENFNIRLV